MYSQDIHEELWQNIFMRIFLLSTFLIWTPLILSKTVYIKIDNADIAQYIDSGRKVSERDDLNYPRSGRRIAIIKIDLDKQLATVAAGVIRNYECVHATVWNFPSDIQDDTKVRFENLEESVNIFEESSDQRVAAFEIDRTTLEGQVYSPFILGFCGNVGSCPRSHNLNWLIWKKGEIIEEDEYIPLFKTFKLADDKATKRFERRKKEKEKEDAEKARKKF